MVKLNKKGYGITEAMAVIGIAIMVVVFTLLLQLRGCADTPEQKIEPSSLKDLIPPGLRGVSIKPSQFINTCFE